jgi:hypothetical protein
MIYIKFRFMHYFSFNPEALQLNLLLPRFLSPQICHQVVLSNKLYNDYLQVCPLFFVFPFIFLPITNLIVKLFNMLIYFFITSITFNSFFSLFFDSDLLILLVNFLADYPLICDIFILLYLTLLFFYCAI